MLSLKQKEVLQCAHEHLEVQGVWPSYRKIAKALGLRSVATVHEHVQALKDKGYWTKEQFESCSIIECLGEVSAGHPIEALSDSQWLMIPSQMINKSGNYFALKVRGSSMQEAGILHGDRVILRSTNVAQESQIVLALLNGQVILKRFFKKNRELRPANSDYKSIFLSEKDQFQIQGVLVGLIRFYV